MNEKNKQSIKKLNGVFYTPEKIVDFLSSWAINNEVSCEVLEPSAGDGRFAKKIVELNENARITAVEINKTECESITQIKNTKAINDDFYDFYEKIKDTGLVYDLVIGNPPYIRYQYLTEHQRNYQSDILTRNGMRPNKLINSWVAFTVASIELVRPGGKFAFVLPTDILQVSYARELRTFIFREMKEVNIIRFNNLVFPNIQQNVILLFGTKKTNQSEEPYLRNINIDGLSQLPNNLDEYPLKKYDFKSSDKWRKLLLNNNMLNFYSGKYKEKTKSFDNFCSTEVGITTGNNNFFVVNSEIVNKYDLKNYAIPLVGRSRDVIGVYYSNSDLIENSKKRSNVWLLDFNNKILNNGAKAYIDIGEQKGENEGYKLRIRDTWYEIPSIWKPDAFLLRRIGKYPKLVTNCADATSTDTFHRIKFKNNIDKYKLIVSFYTSPALLSFELEGRVFGGGALEVLPGDIPMIRLPIINNKLDFKKISDEIDTKLRNKENFPGIVKWVDTIIQPYSKFSKEEILSTYNSWIEMGSNRNK